MSQPRTPAEHEEALLIIPGMSQYVLVLLPSWFQQVGHQRWQLERMAAGAHPAMGRVLRRMTFSCGFGAGKVKSWGWMTHQGKTTCAANDPPVV